MNKNIVTFRNMPPMTDKAQSKVNDMKGIALLGLIGLGFSIYGAVCFCIEIVQLIKSLF